jgi:serine/threonine protein kinase
MVIHLTLELVFGVHSRHPLYPHHKPTRLMRVSSQVEHILNEKTILAVLSHPFIVRMFCHFQGKS